MCDEVSPVPKALSRLCSKDLNIGFLLSDNCPMSLTRVYLEKDSPFVLLKCSKMKAGMHRSANECTV